MKQTILIILLFKWPKWKRTVNTEVEYVIFAENRTHSNDDDHFTWNPKCNTSCMCVRSLCVSNSFSFFAPANTHTTNSISHDFVQIEQISSFSPKLIFILCHVLFSADNNFVFPHRM